MNILVVCSGNALNFDFKIHQAFIYDQIEAIKKVDKSISFEYFFIKGNGIKGYLKNYKRLIKKINENNFDLIHAHVANSGLLANLQRRIPVVTTYHGSDINIKKNRYISFIVDKLSVKNIYVSKKLLDLAIKPKCKDALLIPCGVDFNIFSVKNIDKLKEKWAFDIKKKYILFSSSFNNPVKNFTLLQNALKIINDESIQVIELHGYSREEVSELMNIVDVCILTSFTEGSPQFIKEAMACNCPIVSTDVGDVVDIIESTEGCFITSYDIEDIVKKILKALNYAKLTNGREKILYLDNELIAKKLIRMYKDILL